ncbi:GH10086 [Drosophila grimshawi]|uniref:GH10086 n=1 Tax=Drosophila grimshawi TaxID=7222 RepID=B4K2F8_DROGR|nr:GH10086 [Drosophila grimshawi]
MSEPMSSGGLRFIYNGLLLTTSGLAMRHLSLERQTFAFVACLVGGAAALVGLCRALFGSSTTITGRSRARDVCQGMLELVPLPLINMQLYEHRLGLGNVVLAHGILLLPPLLLDLRCSLVKERKNCDLTETLRDLSMLGNIVSLLFLAAREHNFLYMRMGLVMLLVKYYPVLADSAQEETGEDLIVCGSALLFHQLGHALA